MLYDVLASLPQVNLLNGWGLIRLRKRHFIEGVVRMSSFGRFIFDVDFSNSHPEIAYFKFHIMKKGEFMSKGFKHILSAFKDLMDEASNKPTEIIMRAILMDNIIVCQFHFQDKNEEIDFLDSLKDGFIDGDIDNAIKADATAVHFMIDIINRDLVLFLTERKHAKTINDNLGLRFSKESSLDAPFRSEIWNKDDEDSFKFLDLSDKQFQLLKDSYDKNNFS